MESNSTVDEHSHKSMREPAAISVPAMANIIRKRQRLLDAVIGVLLDHPAAVAMRQETTAIPPTIKPMMPLWVQGMTASAGTLTRLSDSAGFHTRDCFGIARTINETAINICYTLAMGDEVAERAERHAHQKAYRDLHRESAIGDSKMVYEYLGRPEVDQVPGLKDNLEEFTWPRRGREKDWIDISIDDRIGVAGAALGNDVLIRLQGARFSVYRHSSEILHGTFFGAIFFLGSSGPKKPGNPGEMLEHMAQNHVLLLQAADLSISAVIIAFHQKYGFAAVLKANTELTKEIRNVPFFHGAKKKPDAPKAP